MNICCIIGALGAGGAERVLSTLCNHWAQHGRHVTIVRFESGEIPPFFPLNEKIELVSLGITGASRSVWHGLVAEIRRLIRLWRTLRTIRPTVVVSFIDRTNLLAVVASRLSGIPIIVTEHIDPSKYSIGQFRKIGRRALYPWAHAIVLPNNKIYSHFAKHFNKTCVMIPHPVSIAHNTDTLGSTPESPVLGGKVVAMGRLTYQKGFDLLIDAFADVHRQHANWKLDIWGDGELRCALQSQIDNAGMTDVRLCGLTRSPQSVFSAADFFVLSSRFEAFGMVIVEAMAAGLPVVSFDCPSGPNEIITGGEDGVLVPDGDRDALARAMNWLIEHEQERLRMGLNAAQTAKRYDIGVIAEHWEQLFAQIVGG